jgi:HEAT repeat protein
MPTALPTDDSQGVSARLTPVAGKGPLTWRRVAALAVLNLAAVALSLTVGHYGGAWMRSVVASSLVTLVWVALIGLLSYLEALSIRQLVLRGGWRGGQEIVDLSSSPARPWLNFHLPLTTAIVALLGVNMLAFDWVAQGFFIDQQKTNYALTHIRSSDQVMQREGIMAATQLPNLPIRQGLAEALSRPGDLPQWAAWALGQVGTTQEAPALMHLLRQGDRDQRGAAAVALARLGHAPLAQELETLMHRPQAPLESYIVALGLLAHPVATGPLLALVNDAGTAPDHLALAAWALGHGRTRHACAPLDGLIGPDANPLTCAASYSLSQLHCPESVETLEEAFDNSGAASRCDGHAFVDLDGFAIELWPSGLYRLLLLQALIRTGPRAGAPVLRRIANDGSQVPQVRDLARQSVHHRAADK